MSASNFSRRLSAGILMLAVLAVLVASAVPTCGSLCCAKDADAAMRATMPCCEPQQNIERADPMSVAAATPISIAAYVAVPVVLANAAQERGATIALISDPARVAPSPPLFLRHAQLLI
ncbi:MAG TPA: hypothetical protein VF846_17925 [Thermoanaerobaculia bacterium]